MPELNSEQSNPVGVDKIYVYSYLYRKQLFKG